MDHSPRSIAIVSGDGQSAHVSTALPLPPTVVVRDAGGDPVAGVTVSFSVVDGGGWTDSATVATAASGQAACSWTLGTLLGAQHLKASAAGVADAVTFAATGLVGPPSSVSVTNGASQRAEPGTAVASNPVVYVVDASSLPVAGAPVTFTVTGGGGSVQFASASTDASGHASCGAWTLGPLTAMNSLSATVAGIAPAQFYAQGVHTSAAVSLDVILPHAGATVIDPFYVEPQMDSTYSITSVTAAVAGSSAALTYLGVNGNSWKVWAGNLALPGIARGPITLLVTATDAMGNYTETLLPLVLDRAPVVSVLAPLNESLARPMLQITASATDDDPSGPVSLTAIINHQTPLLSAKDSLSQIVDLSAYEGQSIILDITATDTSGTQITVTRTLYVESSAHLTVQRELPGRVWDASGTRFLYLDRTPELPAQMPFLKVFDASTNTILPVEGSWGYTYAVGYLTPKGAIYVHNFPVSPWQTLYEWRDGGLSDLNSSTNPRVAGKWALYSTAAGPELNVRDLDAGTSTLVTSEAYVYEGFDVGPNGDAVYTKTDGNVYRWRAGSEAALTTAGSCHRPLTDGVNVVYKKDPRQIALNDGSNETLLSGAGSTYAVAGGFAAYCSEDASKTLQVWRHTPTGEEQLSFFSTDCTLDAIGPDGTTFFSHSGRRYRAAVGASAADIGSSQGRVLYRDGHYVVLLGRDVLEVAP